MKERVYLILLQNTLEVYDASLYTCYVLKYMKCIHAHTYMEFPTLNQTLVQYVEANMVSYHCDTTTIHLECMKRDS